MRSLRWDRAVAIERVRTDIWRHLTHLARDDDEVALIAAALLQMPAGDVRRLAQVQFVLCGAVGRLLTEMPVLSRRLRTVAESELEVSDDRIRGPIRWGETFSRRAAGGARHRHVTAPARRAFSAPENELLVFALGAIAEQGRGTGWHERASAWMAQKVTERVAEAERWGQLRALAGIPCRQPSATAVGRVRAGRWRRPYGAVLEVIERHGQFVRRLDRDAIKDAIEEHALVTSRDDVLRELCCAFETIAVLERRGWERIGLDGLFVPGQVVFRGRRDAATIEVYYQHLPVELGGASRYEALQRGHDLRVGTLRPDLVLRRRDPVGERWLMVEVKGGIKDVEGYAREAVRDLLVYRRAFEDALTGQEGIYGIGYAWGTELTPSHQGEIVLCTPDTLAEALEGALAAA